MNFLSDRILISSVLYSIAVLIAFGPELRHSLVRSRDAEDRADGDATEPS